ncbi:uncharacterized protein [Eucyclogobius newberryi]|uniref:uncharacterized protein isoform X1 n=1 Tax=Eucyclogobius newberryi TaxID=166745 RepID=UPI003B5CC866
MRALLDSSWMRFAPAGREYEWPTGAPLTQRKEGESWSELDLSLQRSPNLPLYVLLPLGSVLALVLLIGLWFRRCSGSKAALSRVIALDLEDPESQAEILSSLTRNAERLNSTSSDGSDGVFVMVYLPPPYEQTLSRITRASLSSAGDLTPRTSLSSTADLIPRTRVSSCKDPEEAEEQKARGEFV